MLNIDKLKNNRLASSLIKLIAGVILLYVIISLFFSGGGKEIKYSQFLDMIEEGAVSDVLIKEDEIVVRGLNNRTNYYVKQLNDDKLVDRLHEAKIPFERVEDDFSIFSSGFFQILISFGPIILIFYFFSTILKERQQGKGFEIEMIARKDLGVDFSDVAGQEEAKEQLREIINFIHDPEKYHKIGAKIPKGALLVGPPGTGKTLMARAVAGEAKVPFFSVSGSDFVELYVGVGALRVRKMFEEAKQNAPCIIFIDEVDSIAKNRNSAVSGGNSDEKEQTLNQLLSEMDGFDPYSGIMVLAATNRPESLDRAFTRSGRFDRKIVVDSPDFIERVEILKVHSKDVALGEDVDLESIARATTGSVGADLENIMNEAAINAVKSGRDKVYQEDLDYAVELVIAGMEKKNRILSEKERRIVAYHEVGHALVAAVQTNSMPIQKITIVPRTKGSLGYTMQVPEEDTYLFSKEKMMDEIAVLLAGRAAEEVKFSSITTGAANDIERATNIARKMVSSYGMTNTFGMTGFESNVNVYLGDEYKLSCSDKTHHQIDMMIVNIIKSNYEYAKEVISSNLDLLDEVAEFLLEEENISGEDFMRIFNAHKVVLPVKKEFVEPDFSKKESQTLVIKEELFMKSHDKKVEETFSGKESEEKEDKKEPENKEKAKKSADNSKDNNTEMSLEEKMKKARQVAKKREENLNKAEKESDEKDLKSNSFKNSNKKDSKTGSKEENKKDQHLKKKVKKESESVKNEEEVKSAEAFVAGPAHKEEEKEAKIVSPYERLLDSEKEDEAENITEDMF